MRTKKMREMARLHEVEHMAQKVVIEYADGCGLEEDWREHPVGAFEERLIELERLLWGVPFD